MSSPDMYPLLNCERKSFSFVLEKLISWTMPSYWCMRHCATLLAKKFVLALYTCDCILSIATQNSIVRAFHFNKEAQISREKGGMTRCFVILSTAIVIVRHFTGLCYLKRDFYRQNEVPSRYLNPLKDLVVAARRIIVPDGLVPVFEIIPKQRKFFSFSGMS